MTRRWMTAGLIVALLSMTAAADTLEQMEKKIVAAADKVKSGTADIRMVMEMDNPMMTMKSTGKGTMEFMRQGAKHLSRIELKTTMVSKQGDQEQKMERAMLVVTDGDFVYSLTEQFGQKMAMKTRVDPQSQSLASQQMFTQLHEDYTLKALPDEKVGDEAVYVIEATPKQSNAQTGKSIYYYGQASGLMLKMVTMSPQGKPMHTMTVSNVKLNVDLKPERFVFKAPPGVTVQDMTSMPTTP